MHRLKPCGISSSACEGARLPYWKRFTGSRIPTPGAHTGTIIASSGSIANNIDPGWVRVLLLHPSRGFPHYGPGCGMHLKGRGRHMALSKWALAAVGVIGVALAASAPAQVESVLWPDDFLTRVEALLLVETLNAGILA